MSPLNFEKMHGLGNDFVVLNCLSVPFEWTKQDIQHYSNRYTGIGFDQLLIIEPSQHSNVDFTYRIFNSDGNEVEHCGNGARCFGKYLLDKQLFNFKKAASVAVKKGIIEIDYEGNQQNSDYFKVSMGKPNFDFFTENQNSALFQEITLQNQSYQVGIVSMGNPHAVIEMNDIDNIDIRNIGQTLQNHPLFPEQVNVGFMEIVNRNHIKLRVYERGVGETQACGTGACAAVAVGISRKILDSQVTVSLLGGDLQIEWQPDMSLFMTGPAEHIYHGIIKQEQK